jgi:general stress protein YciG
MKEPHVETKTVENVRRRGDGRLGFRGTFRASRKRLREIGKKGFEQMESLNHNDFSNFSE